FGSHGARKSCRGSVILQAFPGPSSWLNSFRRDPRPFFAQPLLLMADTPSESIDVTYVADLARLRLSPEEIATFQKQLGDVLGYVSQLAEVDVSQVSLLGEADLKNRLRADEVRPSLPVAEAL